jgi:lipoprotein LprG
MVLRRVVTGLLVVVALAAVGSLTGCSSTTSTATPTAAALTAPEVLTKSAAAMAEVTSTSFTIAVDGQLPAVTVQSAEGDLTAAGDAQGSAKITQFGQLLEVEFVLVGGELYIKGLTGGFSKVPAALAGSVYDPSAILSPDKGVAKVLSSVQNPTLASSDDGSWVVSGTVPTSVAAALVPGISTDVTGVFTVEMATGYLTAADLSLTGGDGQPAKVTIGLSNFNEPVSISPPG